MKKRAMLLIALMVIIVCFLSGCTDSTPGEVDNEIATHSYNIGESVEVGNIEYKFVSAKWIGSYGSFVYQWRVKGSNIGNIKTSGTLRVDKYVMGNGYMYEPDISDTRTATFIINPGENTTETIRCQSIDRNFLPLEKIIFSIQDIDMILYV